MTNLEYTNLYEPALSAEDVEKPYEEVSVDEICKTGDFEDDWRECVEKWSLSDDIYYPSVIDGLKEEVIRRAVEETVRTEKFVTCSNIFIEFEKRYEELLEEEKKAQKDYDEFVRIESNPNLYM